MVARTVETPGRAPESMPPSLPLAPKLLGESRLLHPRRSGCFSGLRMSPILGTSRFVPAPRLGMRFVAKDSDAFPTTSHLSDVL